MTAADLFREPEGATPIDPDDAADLIPTWIATRADLNAAEAANIAKALAWTTAARSVRTVEALMTETTMHELHRRMFGDVWRWAGRYRLSDTNIGAAWHQVPVLVRDLLADVVAQTQDPAALPWPPDEIAVRFHHRLVAIHPFPNGNGRHARLAADLLAVALGRPAFTWGAADLTGPSEARAAYLAALRRADEQQDFAPLVRFARS